MKMIKWNTTKADMGLIGKIADRVQKESSDYPDDRMTLVMDLIATHANGCALNLRRLLKAPKFDFFHDIYGIRKHINRDTGEIEGYFLPRCAA